MDMQVGRTFSVHAVEPANKVLTGFDGVSLLTHAPWADGIPLATSLRPEDNIVALVQPNLVAAVQLAYAHHYPLVISPDHIWLTIAHGFSLHIRLHAEELRKNLVGHEGQRTLEVHRSGGALDDAAFWADMITEFATKVGHETQDLHDLVLCDFSTTGHVERTASKLVLMDATSPYFRYSAFIICGIPAITLEGEPADWERLRAKVERMEQYGLSAWTKHLLPICDEFVRAARGDIDTAFWQSIFHEHRGCDPESTISGWITTLYPYLNGPGEYLPSKVLTTGRAAFKMADAPANVSKVPLDLIGMTGHSKATLISGIMGVTQDAATLALRPAIGWATLVPQQELVALLDSTGAGNTSNSFFSKADVETLLEKHANILEAMAQSPQQDHFLPSVPAENPAVSLREFHKQVAQQLPRIDAETHYDLAVAYAEIGLRGDAIYEYETAARSPLFQCAANLAAGTLHREMGSLDQAIAAFEKALAAKQISPQQECSIYYELGDALAAQKRVVDALQRFAYLLHICPEYTDPRGDPAERIDRLERGLES